MKYASSNNIYTKTHVQIDWSIFANYGMHGMKLLLFCIFRDFYASGMQDAKVTTQLFMPP